MHADICAEPFCLGPVEAQDVRRHRHDEAVTRPRRQEDLPRGVEATRHPEWLPQSSTRHARRRSRFRLSGKLIKGQRFGGVPDEWVVIEEVDRAAALAERILGAPDGAPLFSNVGISQRIKGLRAWLKNSGLGAH
jgi:hypothetical protein